MCPLPWLATVGAPIVGDIPPTGIFRESVKGKDAGEIPFAESCGLRVQELLAMPPPKPEHMEAIWATCIKEQEIGILRPWHSASEMDAKFGRMPGGLSRGLQFLQLQKQKWRAIDTGRSSGHNDAVDLCERIHTTSTEMGLAVAQRLLRLQAEQRGNAPILRITRDMKNAFRQIERADIHARFHIVAAYNPVLRGWRFVGLSGLAFGIGMAVNHVNRAPAHLLAFARKWMAIPALGFFDNVKITELGGGGGGQAFYYFTELVELFGLVFDPDRDSKPSPVGPHPWGRGGRHEDPGDRGGHPQTQTRDGGCNCIN